MHRHPTPTKRHRRSRAIAQWEERRTLDGVSYFYNKATDALTWVKPDELKTVRFNISREKFLRLKIPTLNTNRMRKDRIPISIILNTTRRKDGFPEEERENGQ